MAPVHKNRAIPETLSAKMAARRFDELELSPTSRRALRALGFEIMTPVQASSIPLLLKHRDVSAEASTGSGKTVCLSLLFLASPLIFDGSVLQCPIERVVSTRITIRPFFF